MDELAEKLFGWRTTWLIERYADDDAYQRKEPYDRSIINGNIALDTGKAEILNLTIGGSANHFDATNTVLGVGDSTTAEAATQTDLQAATNKTYKACDTGWPKLVTTTVTNDTIEAKATFGSADANYAWNEFVIKQNTSAICLNRKVSEQGTKASGQTWVLTLKLQAS